jgi:hemoglobin
MTAETDAAARRPLGRDGRLLPAGLDEAMVGRVVDAFYAAIRRDDVVGPVFEAAIAADAWPRHLGKMKDFWSSMLLGTARYDGRPLPAHLALPGLGEAHFARWLALFRATAEAECAPDVAALFVDRAERVAHSFRLALAFHRGEDTLAVTRLSAAAAGTD